MSIVVGGSRCYSLEWNNLHISPYTPSPARPQGKMESGDSTDKDTTMVCIQLPSVIQVKTVFHIEMIADYYMDADSWTKQPENTKQGTLREMHP